MLRSSWPRVAFVGVLAACGGTSIAAGGDGGDLPVNGDDARFFLPAGRVKAIRALAASSDKRWLALKTNVDAYLPAADYDSTSVANVGVVYLVTGEKKYCDYISRRVGKLMSTVDPRGGSYLEIGEIFRDVGLAVDYCGPVLPDGQRGEMVAYLDRWIDELWFHNKGSGWGLADPGNNYHAAFLEATAYAGYVLKGASHANAQKILDHLTQLLEGPEQQLAYLASRCAGGGWIEGANYGERTKNRLGDTFALIASQGGKNYFREGSFWTDALLYAHHQLQPGNNFVFPSGDMARVADQEANPFDRAYVQEAVYWLPDSDARAYGQWYLEHVVTDYLDGFPDRHDLWRDVVFALDVKSKAQSTLPLTYRASGDGFLAMRSGWDAGATALMVPTASRLDQSHNHLDVGSFTIWKNGWQAIDSVVLSHSGLLQLPEAHNMINLQGATMQADVSTRGLVHFTDDASLSYLQIDGTGLFVDRDGKLMKEWTRELVYLKPDTVVVYDRVQPVDSGRPFDWRLHLPRKPTQAGAIFSASNEGGALTLQMLQADTTKIMSDSDVGDGSQAWRVQASSASGRFLAAIKVASGSAPPLTATRLAAVGEVDGLAVGNVVIVVSRKAMGAPAALGFTYTVPTQALRKHTLFNMSGAVDASIVKAGGSTTVTVTAGSRYSASSEGVVTFTE